MGNLLLKQPATAPPAPLLPPPPPTLPELRKQPSTDLVLDKKLSIKSEISKFNQYYDEMAVTLPSNQKYRLSCDSAASGDRLSPLSDRLSPLSDRLSPSYERFLIGKKHDKKLSASYEKLTVTRNKSDRKQDSDLVVIRRKSLPVREVSTNRLRPSIRRHHTIVWVRDKSINEK